MSLNKEEEDSEEEEEEERSKREKEEKENAYRQLGVITDNPEDAKTARQITVTVNEFIPGVAPKVPLNSTFTVYGKRR